MNNMMKTSCLLILLIGGSLQLLGQSFPTFAQLKETADEHSLPLVNLTVDIWSVRRISS